MLNFWRVLLTQCILDRIVKPVDGLRINHGQMNNNLRG